MSRKIDTKIQGDNESIIYQVTTTEWGSDPTGVLITAEVWSNGTWTDVTDTVLSGEKSVNGDVITLPAVENLTAGKTYRVNVMFTAGGNTFDPYLEIHAEQ